jgi:tetratricopeptide (TPR) repeat protein
MTRDAEKAGRLGDDALDRLEKLTAAEPRNAEALALTGAIQGLVISLKPAEMMTLGPQSFANLAHAVAIAPDDPRTHLLTGISRLHEPQEYGGGPQAALAEFQRAQELFAKAAPADSTAADWGRDDAFLWEGRARMQLRDFAAARDAFRRALAANAGNQWVRMRLLPAAEDSLREAHRP